jgi:2-oxo-3-hexenedioate decarboxylase
MCYLMSEATDPLSDNSLATKLLAALDQNRLLEPITAGNPMFDAPTAYRVSAEIFRRRCTRGETPIGRKIGFTNRLIWDEYGVSSPMWGHVYDSTVTRLNQPTAQLAIGHLSQPRIEPEIVLHFAQPPGAATNEIELLATIDWIAHGFEIVQTHFLDWKFTLADTIADFGLHGALIVGPPRSVTELDDIVHRLRAFTIALAKNGARQATGAGANVLDSPLMAALHLVRVLRDQPFFEPIRAGEIVTTGTLTPALPIHAGETWTTSLSGIDLPGLTLHFE